MGETARFDRLYEEHASAVLAYALRRTDAASADDVLGDVFLVAWRRIDDVPAEALPWLLGVARRVLGNQRRSFRRQDALRERLQTHTAPMVEETDGRVLTALSTLSEADRELLLLIAWDGLSASDAATVLGIRPSALSMRLSRARNRLRTALAGPATRPLSSTTTGASS